MKKLYILILIMAGFLALNGTADVFADDDDRGKRFEVTVTNITPGSDAASGQILNGLVVATHNRDFRLFDLGQPSSDELAKVAEDALNADLVAALSANPDVCDVQTIGIVNPPTIFPILPGGSASVVVTANGSCRFLSLAAMLVTTNDAFAALNGVRLPRRSSTFLALAYDAGSEANTENCSDIPGPPCGNINRVGDGEGYVSIHSGIHGVGSPLEILPSERDWRNPVAIITIDRVDDDNNDDDDDD